MRKVIFLIFVSPIFFACEGDIKVNEQKVDSAGAKLQRTVEKGVDSIAAKIDRLEDKLDKDDTLKK